MPVAERVQQVFDELTKTCIDALQHVVQDEQLGLSMLSRLPNQPDEDEEPGGRSRLASDMNRCGDRRGPFRSLTGRINESGVGFPDAR